MNKKYDMYQDKDGNVYNLTTEVEQLMTEALIELQDKLNKAIEYINRNTCANVEEQCNSLYLYDEYLNNLLNILRGNNER